MPGDPLRAQYIAENFLENVEQFNTVRNMFWLQELIRQRSFCDGLWMGIPSIGIYSYELYHFFDVDTIIRVGSCGALQEDVNLYDVIIAKPLPQTQIMLINLIYQVTLPIADYNLVAKAKKAADEIGAISCR